MSKVEIYTRSWCGYSRAALRLLDRKQIEYTHIDVTDDREQEQIMIARSGAHSVPQVFINGQSVGGYDDIAALNATGELDKLLTEESQSVLPAELIKGVQSEQLHNT